jgi:small multidrug resistance pump
LPYLLLTIALNASASLLLKLATTMNGAAKLTAAGGSTACYIVAFLTYYATLRNLAVSVAYPVMTGGAILTITVIAPAVVGEPVTSSKAIGAVLILTGAVLLLKSQK